MKRHARISIGLIALGGLLLGWTGRAVGAGASPAAKPPVPDFTQGGQRDASHDWTLGPTGARGWVYGWKGQTADARQILVTAVAKGSPADGILISGDVILGVGDRPFSDDARIRFARAIAAAEELNGGGRLKLTRWRDGKTETVELKLTVMGAYSDTAPYDCPKSKAIVAQGCRAIAKKGLDNVSIPNSLNALALLAAGREEDRPLLAGYARKVADYKVVDFASWHYGYATLFLAEYVAATGDQTVMPGLRRLAGEIARGASAVGTWGHKFARPSGNCNGYGCMNSPGIVLAMALVMARDAGVKDPDADRCIAKSSQFLRWYVNKGAIPYGDHQPWPGHEDNGKCSGAAVLFDLLGDREATSFFAKMSTAAYNERERGHTGNFFNILWALPGVSRCGPLATGAYWKEQAWYYDLARGWDGSFAYQGSPAGEEEHGKYTNWDCTGAYLLTYTLPLRRLYLTGKKPCSVLALKAREVDEVIAAGRDFSTLTAKDCYAGRTTDQLLAGLSSWSPAVRTRSAQALGRREGDFVPTLLTLLAGSQRDARYGACEAVAYLGPRADAAAPRLRALLEDPDPWLQSLACKALPALGPEARQASVSDLLRMTVRPNPADPRRMAQRAACIAMFAPYPGSGGPKSILAESLEGVDRQLLYPAIQSILENDDGAARGSLQRVYRELTDDDLVRLLPAVIQAIDRLAPSNEMFGDGIRLAGLDLVSRLHLREGMPRCVSIIEPDRWGQGKRLPKCLEYLGRYGAHAKAVLPQLREVRQEFVKAERGRGPSENLKLLDASIAAIEASTALPTVLDLKDFTARPVPRHAPSDPVRPDFRRVAGGISPRAKEPHMSNRMTLPCLCLALLLANVAHAADGKQTLPKEDVVGVPAISPGLCVSNAFQTNMVLQRDKPLAIWGWAEPGEEVSVSFAGQQARATAAADRSWRVTLEALPANSSPQTMTVKGKSKTLTLENILVGDVWLLGGQSNMEFPLSNVDDGPLEIVSANFPQIRLLTMPVGKGFESVGSFERLDEWSDWSSRHFRKGDWEVCSPETVKEFSAIGYVFGRRLFMATGVPIGLIDASIGGTTVETWTPRDVLDQIDGQETREMLKDWEERIAAYDAQADLKKRIESYNANKEKMKDQSKPAPTDLRPGPAADKNRPGHCYAGVIKPLRGLTIKGAIFHQGFNNCFDGSAGARMYYQVFGKMIAAWRATFNDPRMPFGILSLCTAGEPQTLDNYLPLMYDVGPYIREAQYKTFRGLYDAGDKNIGYASSFDLRKSWYHPQIKIPVGERAAKWALVTQYGKLTGRDADEHWLPPTIKEVKIVEGTIRLTMSAAIKLKDDSSDKLEGFAIAGDDRRFHPARVDWYTDGTKDNRNRPVQSRNILVLSSPFVPQPTHYRYAWARNPLANLVNGRQVPLATQRSDDWILEETPEKIAVPQGMPADAARRYAANQIRKALEQADIERRLKEAEATSAALQPLLDKAKAEAEKKKAIETKKAAAAAGAVKPG